MIKSMTGFGRSEYTGEERTVLVEIRSVNHRYTDMNIRLPKNCGFAEEAVRAAVKKRVARGKVDVFVRVEPAGAQDVALRLNMEVARSYIEAFGQLKSELGIEGETGLPSLITMPGIFEITHEEEDEESATADILKATEEALDNFDTMREAEGDEISKDILKCGDRIEELANLLEEQAPEIQAQYLAGLKARMAELLAEDSGIAEERIVVEAAIMADKTGINEEVVRLKSHVAQMRRIFSQDGGPAGKKLDFLAQEMNREANTIGSKAGDLSVTEVSLSLKSEIEKIREQVQNLE